MSGDSLAVIMSNAGGKAIAAAYQAAYPAADAQPPPSAPRCSIVTSHNLGEPLLYPDDDEPLRAAPLPAPRRAQQQQQKKGPRAIRKTTHSDLNLKNKVPDLKAMDKYVDSPLALSRFDPSPFLDDFVFDNAPSIGLQSELPQHEDRFWPPPSRSVETSPSSSVSAISPVGTGPLWPPPGRSSSPLDASSLVDVFENLRPFSSRFYY